MAAGRQDNEERKEESSRQGTALGEQLKLILEAPDFPASMERLREVPLRPALRAMLSLLPQEEGEARLRLAAAAGALVARLTEEDPEGGREMMRRLMWSLNEESGNCAVGVPETMAEAMVRHEGLAAEFAHVLISFLAPEGLYLDYAPLQRGVVWGLGRLAERRPELVIPAAAYLEAVLTSPEAETRSLAQRALGLIRDQMRGGGE
jgi:hypothetical protein